MRRHLLDVPTPVDDVHTLCGLRLTDKRIRREQVTGLAAIVTCVSCLRTRVAVLEADVAVMQDKTKGEP